MTDANRSPPELYKGKTTVERVLDILADVILAGQMLMDEFRTWDRRIVRGRIMINGVESTFMSQNPPIDISDVDVPVVVDWEDRFGDLEKPESTVTTWSVLDATGAVSPAASVVPDAADDEAGMLTFSAGSGIIQVKATTPGPNGDVVAVSALYNITPGAVSQGQVLVNQAPVPAPPATPVVPAVPTAPVDPTAPVPVDPAPVDPTTPTAGV
jgi:hypothetical protein